MGGVAINILDTIARRISIRSYDPEPAPLAELEAVRAWGGQADALTDIEMQFLLRSHAEMGREVKGILGTYGKTIVAPHYIVIASREGEGYLTDAGFRFQQVILEATRRGLGTCWVGLMFDEGSLRSCLDMDSSWRMIALTPIGRPGDPTFVSRSLRSLVRSATRRSLDRSFFWKQHGSPLPPHIVQNDRLNRLLEAARWAPSWKNIQPWYFILTGQEIMIYKKKQHDRQGKDYHLLDCGIAMANFHLAARALGFDGRWRLGAFEVPGERDAEPVGRFPLSF